MRLAFILGTRPEIIKMAPLIRRCDALSIEYYVLHSGQHYDYEMDKVFFDQLHLNRPKYNLQIGSGSHGQQTARIIEGVEEILSSERQDFVIVQGDTNTVLAASIAATKMHIKLGHVEAGLRSYDRLMPEEINRIVADHCSNLLFAPTQHSQQVLLSEGIRPEVVFNTGNTIVDAIYQNLALSHNPPMTFESIGLEEGKYFLLTLHREENVDNPNRLKIIIKALDQLHKEFEVPIIFPVHPRSAKMLKEFNIHSDNLTLVSPTDYFSFLNLEKNSMLIFTDSGGVQEEACVLRVPCVTLRCNTERPESIEVGANIVAGINSVEITRCAKIMISKSRDWQNPFGDGNSSARIIDILRKDCHCD